MDEYNADAYEDESQWDDQLDAVYNPNQNINLQPGGGKMNFQEGDEIEVIGNMSGANMMGQKLTVAGYAGQFVRLENCAYNFYEQDLELIGTTKDRVELRAKKAKLAAQRWQDKLEYLESTGKEELKEDDFKEYLLDKVLSNDNLSPEQKKLRIKAMYEK